MRILGQLTLCYVVTLATMSARLCADVRDPLDPLDRTPLSETEDGDDDTKSPDQLISEAEELLRDQRPLDARTKLLRALAKDPKRYEAHILLGGYYLVHVGHFRLALRYIKQAQEIFFEKYGKPPYRDPLIRVDHARLLYFLAQTRLDLDNYQGALDVLDEYASHGYMSTWYPSSRAWVLMKLGRLEEAIKVARMGIMQLGFVTDGSQDRGRIFNMLGILLSMHEDKEESLQVFREAILYEQSLGTEGQPATPLNNSGEVYRELFQDEKAESQWLRATSSHDGCEHVLPSLNLALLYVEQAQFQAAKRTMDQFESCVAQFPLRNGEEHRALVHMMRGRIASHTGHLDQAIHHFEEALSGRQWFGKIGTSQADMVAATSVSLAQALERRSQRAQFFPTASVTSWAALQSQRLNDTLRAWWLYRRARQILTEDLNQFEDLEIRNTDSMLEYPTLGNLLTTFPHPVLSRKITALRAIDRRPEAGVFYDAYLAQNHLVRGDPGRGVKLLNSVTGSVRPRADELLRITALVEKLHLVAPGSAEYGTIATDVFSSMRAALPNAGLRLPVNFNGSSTEIADSLSESGFYIDNSRGYDHTISAQHVDGEYVVEFSSVTRAGGNVKVRGNDLAETVRKFFDEVFTVELQ